MCPEQGNTSFHAMAAPNSNNLLLNSNHSYFLLSDDGTIGRIGFEAILRKKLEKCISQQISTRKGSLTDQRNYVDQSVVELPEINDQLSGWYADQLVDCLIERLICWPIDWQIDWLTDWVKNWLSNHMIERWIGWPSDWKMDWLTNWLKDWLADQLIERLIGWPIDWKIYWLTNWLVFRLADWLSNWLANWLTAQCSDWQFIVWQYSHCLHDRLTGCTQSNQSIKSIKSINQYRFNEDKIDLSLTQPEPYNCTVQSKEEKL